MSKYYEYKLVSLTDIERPPLPTLHKINSAFTYEHDMISKLGKEVEELKKIVDEQQKMIDLLWYAPGMPGTFEGKERFNKICKGVE